MTLEDRDASVLDKYTIFATLERVGPSGVIRQAPACRKCQPKKAQCYCYLKENLLSKVDKTSRIWPHLEPQWKALNDIKCLLNTKDLKAWSAHTDAMFPGSCLKPLIRQHLRQDDLQPPEMLTNSWIKLYEILARLKLLEHKASQPTIQTLHLAEGPGGFISATNHYLKTHTEFDNVQWNWKANTLDTFHEHNDWHEMLDNNLFYKETYGRWLRGFDGTGNLTKARNFDQILKELGPTFRVDLVTADGSFDTLHDPESQEELIFPLLLSEVLQALGVLQMDGCFVVKMYALHTFLSIGILALIANCFEKVHLTKPLLSKPGNSEIYVVGYKFKGVSSTLFEACRSRIGRAVVPGLVFLQPRYLTENFVKSATEVISMFTKRQTETIENNLRVFEGEADARARLSMEEKRELAMQWIEAVELKPIAASKKLVIGQYLHAEKGIQGNELHEQKGGARMEIASTLEERLSLRRRWEALQQSRVNKFVQRAGDDLTIHLNPKAFEQPLKSPPGFSKEGLEELKDFQTSTSADDPFVFLLDAAVADKIALMVPGRDLRAQYGKWVEEAATLKPFHVVSSPYFSPDIFRGILELRSQCSCDLLPMSFSDIGFALSAAAQLPPSSTASSHAQSRFGVAYDVGLQLLWRYRGREVKPVWLDICSLSNYSLELTANSSSPASLPLRMVGCKGITVNIGPAVTLGQEEENLCLNSPGLHDRNQLKASLRQALSNFAGRPAGVSMVLVDVSCRAGTTKKEIAQDEIDEQRRLLNALLIALGVAAPGADFLITFHSLVTRFSGSLILLMATIFKDLSIWRSRNTSPWTQRRYCYFRGLDRSVKVEEMPRVERVRAALKSCCEMLDNVDKRDPKSIHYVLPPVLFGDYDFADWLQKANDRLGIDEYNSLHMIISAAADMHSFARDPNLRKLSPEARKELFGDNQENLQDDQDGNLSWISFWNAYIELLRRRFNHLHQKMLDLFKFRALFDTSTPRFDGLKEWMDEARPALATDLDKWNQLPLQTAAAINGDLEKALSDEGAALNLAQLRRHPSFLEWGFDFVNAIAQPDFAAEREYFFGGLVPSCLGLARASEEEEIGNNIEQHYRLSQTKPSIANRLENIIRTSLQ